MYEPERRRMNQKTAMQWAFAGDCKISFEVSMRRRRSVDESQSDVILFSYVKNVPFVVALNDCHHNACACLKTGTCLFTLRKILLQ